MWVGGNKTTEHSGSFDLNPKKRDSVCGKERQFFQWQ